MSGDTQSRHCWWLMLVVSLAHNQLGATPQVLATAALCGRGCRRRCACPSGLNATLYNAVRVASHGLRRGLAGVGVPHPHRAVGAAGDDAPPVGPNATLFTLSECPVSAVPTGWPVPASHTRTYCRRCRRRCACRRG